MKSLIHHSQIYVLGWQILCSHCSHSWSNQAYCDVSCFLFLFLFFFFVLFCFFLGGGFPGQGSDLSCDLWPLPQLWQGWILNPLCQGQGSNPHPWSAETPRILWCRSGNSIFCHFFRAYHIFRKLSAIYNFEFYLLWSLPHLILTTFLSWYYWILF